MSIQSPTQNAYATALRKHVEKLESARAEVCLIRDREAVDLIDEQIKLIVSEWWNSILTEEVKEPLKKTA
ncbi:MAG TPA: hypothetical protein VET48_12005 [Steroidobacteraceae bacterium]|nr:hypothetical protein [Steroidobacteraceae bacterium]